MSWWDGTINQGSLDSVMVKSGQDSISRKGHNSFDQFTMFLAVPWFNIIILKCNTLR